MKKLYLIAFLLLGLTAGTQAQNNVGIGTNTPDASAVLDITSTTKGALFPRMNTTQRNGITSPATGLTIYNTTTNCIEFYNGTAWQASACKCASAPYAGISGPAKVGYNQTGITYTANYDPSYTYTWTVGGYATIASGAGTNTITVNTASGGTLGVGRTYTVALTISNYCGTSTATPITVTSGGYIKWGWSNSITDNLFFVDGINSIQIKAWGAGGGSGDSGGGTGGGGGYATGTLTPTLGTFLYIIVGKGGVYNPGNTVSAEGGGATTTSNATNSGGGGGYTGIFSTSTPTQASALIIAGGGGGCGRNNADGKGGGGGGQDGYSAGGDVNIGKGGGATAGVGGASCTTCTSTCAGAGTNGSALQGGNGGANYNCRQSGGWGAGGAGGGGYWGGGGGSTASSSSTKWYPGGGGGSSYIGGVTSGSMTAASYVTRANDTDSDLTLGQANGGAGSGAVGGNGVLVFRW